MNTSNFDWLKDDGIFMPMLNDANRNIFYKQAIESSVKDKVVVDIGAGTGLLSVLASKAGAKKVYGFEKDPGRAVYARSIVEKLKLTNVEIINQDFLTTNIPADIYVSETIGSQIFDENIIGISNHALAHGGEFIPGKIELYAKVFVNHPIFSLAQSKPEVLGFQPGISIDPQFETLIDCEFQQKHLADDRLYRANYINNLFSMLHMFNDLKLNMIYQSNKVVVDFNKHIDVDSLRIVIPYSRVKRLLTVENSGVCVVLFWRAIYKDFNLDITDTIWSNPSKIILPELSNAEDIVMWYHPGIKDWKLSY